MNVFFYGNDSFIVCVQCVRVGGGKQQPELTVNEPKQPII